MEMFCRVTHFSRTLSLVLGCLSLAQGAALPFRQDLVTPVRLGNQPERPVYQLRAFGRDFTLRLVPDSGFLSPAFRVEHLPKGEPGLPQPQLDSLELARCFYSGRVNDQAGSEVALSLCQGLRGSFHTDGEEYQIEPLEPGDGGAERPHLLRWRSAAASEEQRAVPESPGQRNGSGAARSKRFVSEARYIETMLVADSSMLHFHGAALQHYLLSLMAMVARLYRHPSLRNLVNLVVVKLLVLHRPKDGPTVSSNAGLTLRNFCRWQRDYNQPSDRHPQHFDTAILFTRQDICGHLNCDTLGVADTGTMCDRSRSCAVIEDDGLQTAYTVAHELGHELSMPHDDSKPCNKLFGQIGGNHMMAPLFIRLNRTLPWSPCSAFYITEFFDNGHATQ